MIKILKILKLIKVFSISLPSSNIFRKTYPYRNNIHWSNFGKTPIDSSVLKKRESLIRKTYLGKVKSYEELIKTFVEGKLVLDLGAADHAIVNTNGSKQTVHEIVCKYAKKTFGLDICKIPSHSSTDLNCEHIREDLLSQRNISRSGRKIDIKNNLAKQVEVIFAGHIIEHLSAPIEIFEFAKEIISVGSEILLVTPNPLWFYGLVSRNAGASLTVNPDHTSLFGVSELVELGERSNFQLLEWGYAGKEDMLTDISDDYLENLSYNTNDAKKIKDFYFQSRVHDLAFAHNHLFGKFKKL